MLVRQEWEQAASRQFTCSKASKNAAHGATTSILDIKFSKNGQTIAAACQDKQVYIMNFHDGDYHASKACQLENGFPVAINFSEDSKKLVISTN